MRLSIVPVTLAEANAFVAEYHRHSKPVRGHKYSLGVASEDGVLRGVCIVGRPIARMLQDGATVELLRVATDGTRNACSMLEGSATKAALAMGIRRVVTYTRKHEGGASLRAAGFRVVAEVKGRQWSRPSRPRGASDGEEKWRWEKTASL